MSKGQIDNSDVTPREMRLENGWQRGACINLKDNETLLASLPGILIEKVNQCNAAYLMPLLYDCALIDDDFQAEPWSPVLVFWDIENPQGNLKNGKNPRIYHFELEVSGEKRWFEGAALGLWMICRNSMLSATVDKSMSWPERVLVRILIWAASRITRSVFPDDWNRRMHSVSKRLEKIWKSDAYANISEVFLYIEETTNGYKAKVILVIPDEVLMSIGQRAYFKADGPGDELAGRLKGVMSGADGVEVSSVQVMPESQITLSMLREYESWPLDYYSFRLEQEGALPAAVI